MPHDGLRYVRVLLVLDVRPEHQLKDPQGLLHERPSLRHHQQHLLRENDQEKNSLDHSRNNRFHSQSTHLSDRVHNGRNSVSWRFSLLQETYVLYRHQKKEKLLGQVCGNTFVVGIGFCVWVRCGACRVRCTGGSARSFDCTDLDFCTFQVFTVVEKSVIEHVTDRIGGE